MPRLNHGTLLENLTVLEVTRALAQEENGVVELAAAFAMPPLTQCWHRTEFEPQNNPRFNAEVMEELFEGNLPVGDATSYAGLLYDCLQNMPDLPVVPYALDDAWHLCQFGGPNGALLAAMLRRRQGQKIRLWSNDLNYPQTRYHAQTELNPGTECPLTNQYAAQLTQEPLDALGLDAFYGGVFPDSINHMAAWRGPCTVRVGFLDPDSYVAGGNPEPGQVDSVMHTNWLTNLHQDSSCTAGIMFFASQHAPGRPALIEAFHNDAVEVYPASVVFRHGNFMAGVKVRSETENLIPNIIHVLEESWATWSELVGRAPDGLYHEVNGQ